MNGAIYVFRSFNYIYISLNSSCFFFNSSACYLRSSLRILFSVSNLAFPSRKFWLSYLYACSSLSIRLNLACTSARSLKSLKNGDSINILSLSSNSLFYFLHSLKSAPRSYALLVISSIDRTYASNWWFRSLSSLSNYIISLYLRRSSSSYYRYATRCASILSYRSFNVTNYIFLSDKSLF